MISLEKAEEQKVNSLPQEVKTLLCHGLLHLLGYDHEKNELEYKRMMEEQKKLIKNNNKELLIKWD